MKKITINTNLKKNFKIINQPITAIPTPSATVNLLFSALSLIRFDKLNCTFSELVKTMSAICIEEMFTCWNCHPPTKNQVQQMPKQWCRQNARDSYNFVLL